MNEYNEANIFNDETDLFYKLLPEEFLVFKKEACSGKKQAKQWLTIPPMANICETEKLPLLIKGNSQNPSCFKGFKLLSVI